MPGRAAETTARESARAEEHTALATTALEAEDTGLEKVVPAAEDSSQTGWVSMSAGAVGGSSRPDLVSMTAVEAEDSYRSPLLRAVHWAEEDRTAFDSLEAKWEAAHTAAAEAMRIAVAGLAHPYPTPGEGDRSFAARTWRRGLEICHVRSDEMVLTV
jgi:hypothetical protein